MTAYILAMLFLIMVPLLLGYAILRVFRVKETGISGLFVVGAIAVLFVAFGTHFVGAKWGLSLQLLEYVFLGVILGILAVCGALILIVRSGKKREPMGAWFFLADKKSIRAYFLPGAMLVLVMGLCFLNMHIYEPSYGHDMTIQKSFAIMQAQKLYHVHPATGAELTFGVSGMEKLDFLPTLYAMICSGVGMQTSAFQMQMGALIARGDSAIAFLTGIVPFFTFLLHFSAVYCALRAFVRLLYRLASKNAFFARIKQTQLTYSLGMIYLVMLVTWDKAEGSYFWDLAHRGWASGNVYLLFAIPVCICAALLVVSWLVEVIYKGRRNVHAPFDTSSQNGYPSWKRGVVTVALCFAVSVSGTAFPCMPREDLVRNYKNPATQLAPELMEVLACCAQMEAKGIVPYVSAPMEVLAKVRLYDANVVTTYGEDIELTQLTAGFHDTYAQEQVLLCQYMEGGADVDASGEIAVSLGCNVFVETVPFSDVFVTNHPMEFYASEQEKYYIYTR